LTAFGRLELERQKYKATYSFQAGVVNVWFAQSNQPRINQNRVADLQDFENSRPINFRFVPT